MQQERKAPQLRYVCLSDMHFGAENSIITKLKREAPSRIQTSTDTSEASPVLSHLVRCLEKLIGEFSVKEHRPTLILNGDIFEFAIETEQKALMSFESFVPTLQSKDLFQKIIFIPGNHDHHVWEGVRERPVFTYLIQGIVEAGEKPQARKFITSLFHKGLTHPFGTVHYPNYGDRQGEKCVIFTHGHFIESIYSLISTLKELLFPGRLRASSLQDLEAENAAWIDFFWSALGRSDNNRDDLQALYEQIQDEEEFDRLLSRLAENIARKYDLLGRRAALKAQAFKQLTDAVEAKLLEGLLKTLLRNVLTLERHDTRSALSPDGERGLRTYVSGLLREQLVKENDNRMPSDVTLIFGHTHKPFQKMMNFLGGYRPVKVFNSGGWVVDAKQIHGGAVILVDNDLNTVSLRVYDEAAEKYEVRVKAVEGHCFSEAVQSWIARDENKGDWRALAEAVQKAVCGRRDNLLKKRGQGEEQNAESEERRER